MSFAELTAIGNVGKSPEVRYSPEGKKFCHFSVASNEGVGKKDKEGNNIKETTWFNVTCTGNLVNVATNFLKKGDSVFIRGKLKVRKYNSSNGMEVSLDLFATTIHLMPNNRANESSSNGFASAFDDEDPTDFNPEQYEEESEKLSLATSSNSSNPSPNPKSTSNKATAAPGALGKPK
jgi:single-strand DNA-binding protein